MLSQHGTGWRDLHSRQRRELRGMHPVLHQKLRALFNEASTAVAAALHALGPEGELIAVDEEALVEATLRLQQIITEATAIQDSEAR